MEEKEKVIKISPGHYNNGGRPLSVYDSPVYDSPVYDSILSIYHNIRKQKENNNTANNAM